LVGKTCLTEIAAVDHDRSPTVISTVDEKARGLGV